MTSAAALLTQLDLRGITAAPAQHWRSVRLVPLLREHVRDDLRLAARRYDAQRTVVSLEGETHGAGVKYVSFVPHGLVMTWSDDGEPAAAFGGQLAEAGDGGRLYGGAVRVLHRMARREGDRSLRFLPLHLALEGFLALHFGGPDIAWSEYSRRAISDGLDPRIESALSGRGFVDLADALRVFEIHDAQIGVLLFIGDVLATAFVTPHPDDYRALHPTLLEDAYGADLVWAASSHPRVSGFEITLDDQAGRSIESLRAALAAERARWSSFQIDLGREVLARPLESERVYRAGPFSLQRFTTELDPRRENHLGEAIVRNDGTLEYLRTFRLTAAQTRRAYLLETLARHRWELDTTAAFLRSTREELMVRLDRAGFGYLLHEHILAAARRRTR